MDVRGDVKRRREDLQIVVVGGGVAGLNAARLLHSERVDFQLLEARDRLGGRVLTVDEHGASAAPGFDLGPSWVWPTLQPVIATLVHDLDLDLIPQVGEGDVVFERMSRESARRYTSEPHEAESMRFRGGAGRLVQAIAARVPAENVHLGVAVRELALEGGGVRVTTARQDGTSTVVHADQVIVAVPPRLLEHTVSFDPPLGQATEALWRSTPTWMAPHAKFFAIYERPFWRTAGLSGTAQSMVGPMLEIHDASLHDGQAALFGFLGIGALERSRLDPQELEQACITQLVRLFGPLAPSPRATLSKDWANDPFTATEDDPLSSGQPRPVESWVEGPWASCLVLASSETSPHEAGYLAGAIEASTRATDSVLQQVALATSHT